MVATWRIDSRLNFVHVKFSGYLDTDTLIDGFAAFTADPAWKLELDRIYDLSAVDSFDAPKFRPEEIIRAARRVIGEDLVRSGRVVVIAGDDVAFAMHRLLAAMHGAPEGRFTVVRRSGEAAGFLGLEPAALGGTD